MAQPNETAEGSVENAPSGIVVEVDGEKKTLTVDDVKGLMASQAKATQAGQIIEKLTEKARALNLDPDTFIEQSTNAFGTLGSLFEQKVIDEEGNVLIKAADTSVKPVAPVAPSAKATQLSAEDIAKQALEHLAPTMKGILEENQRMRADLNSMVRLRLEDELTKKHPSLTSDDVSRVLALSVQAGGKKDLFALAKEVEAAKQAHEAEIEERIAKKFGLDLKKLNENLLFQQGGGGAAAVLSGKALSFRKGVNGAVDPKTAAKEYLSRIGV